MLNVGQDLGQASPGGHQEGREEEGDRAHLAATCLPRKGKAGHWREGSEQTWQQVGAASVAWDVAEEQLPPRGPCRHTWLLSSGFYPGSSPAEDTAIWQQALLREERGGQPFQNPREQSHRGEAGSGPGPRVLEPIQRPPGVTSTQLRIHYLSLPSALHFLGGWLLAT